MSRLLLSIAVRLALCAAVAWGVWRLMGTVALVLTAPLWGIALARPLIEVASDLWHYMRQANWRALEGRHYDFRGKSVSVIEDSDKQRWIRLADARAIVGFTASDGALKITYPNGFRLLGKPPEAHLSDEALLVHLGKERSPVALKFRHWVERQIVFPARRQRERHGVRLESLDFRSSD
ncbi:MAG: hypothetical protein ABJA61_00960 [Caldimonas sp.]